MKDVKRYEDDLVVNIKTVTRMDIDDFKRMGIWIPYMKVAKDGHIANKPSLNGIRYAKWSNRSVLMTYDEAVDLAQSLPGLEGVGFVIPEGYAVIVLDKCYDESDNLNSIAGQQVYKFRSYAEKSPSGKGLHILAKANLSGYSKDTFYIEGQSIEVLTPGNFVTYTGNNINATANGIEERTAIIQKTYDMNGKKRKKPVERGKAADYAFGEPHDCPYGKARLRDERDTVKRAMVGSRTNTLFRAAFNMGGLILDGHISEDEVVRELEAAGGATGLSYAKVGRTVEGGLKAGKLHPRDVKCEARSYANLFICW
jgi:hypothetical protein